MRITVSACILRISSAFPDIFRCCVGHYWGGYWPCRPPLKFFEGDRPPLSPPWFTPLPATWMMSIVVQQCCGEREPTCHSLDFVISILWRCVIIGAQLMPQTTPSSSWQQLHTAACPASTWVATVQRWLIGTRRRVGDIDGSVTSDVPASSIATSGPSGRPGTRIRGTRWAAAFNIIVSSVASRVSVERCSSR